MDANEEMLNVPLSKEAKAGLAQIAKEQKLMKQLGIAPEEAQPKNGKDEDED